MSTNEVQQLWKHHWKNQVAIEETGSFYGKLLHQKRLVILQKILKSLDSSSTVIDIGCGSGSTIASFKQAGFNNIIGIDFAEESMGRCENRGFVYGKDVFLMDAKNTSFSGSHFDIVFSEGLWEHFIDPRPHMAEAARLAKTYIIVIQPDHFSFFGFLMHLGWNLFSKNKGGVKEYSFPLSYFINFLKLYHFDLISSKSTILHEQTVMVFKKNSVWQTSQQHEFRYSKTKESKRWRIPYSLEYWKKFMDLDSVEGQGIEIGCGTHGIYNFTQNIVGLDSINFHHKSFTN
jgi:SAM-dependent methyltransferase